MEYKSKKIEPYGFKQLDPIPSQESLAEFYSQKTGPAHASLPNGGFID